MKEINRFYIMGNKLPSDDGSIVNYKDHTAIVDEKDARIAALQEQVRALAAESVTLKDAVMDRIKLHEEIRSKGTPPHTDFWHRSIWMADKKVEDALKNTTATEAALREIRAQAVDGFAQDCDDNYVLVEPEDEELYVLMAESARTHAARIRAGEKS